MFAWNDSSKMLISTWYPDLSVGRSVRNGDFITEAFKWISDFNVVPGGYPKHTHAARVITMTNSDNITSFYTVFPSDSVDINADCRLTCFLLELDSPWLCTSAEVMISNSLDHDRMVLGTPVRIPLNITGKGLHGLIKTLTGIQHPEVTVATFCPELLKLVYESIVKESDRYVSIQFSSQFSTIFVKDCQKSTVTTMFHFGNVTSTHVVGTTISFDLPVTVSSVRTAFNKIVGGTNYTVSLATYDNNKLKSVSTVCTVANDYEIKFEELSDHAVLFVNTDINTRTTDASTQTEQIDSDYKLNRLREMLKVHDPRTVGIVALRALDLSDRRQFVKETGILNKMHVSYGDRTLTDALVRLLE
jgi:hypothetical protein